ncbi:Mth938-like domain-containing protein [Magnetospirillum moscoviense]|uniref:Uncharacterized protein n=1 Tax=Magnetospirillum moscoviense TaxID=1437059 RepID=A0A178MPS8_9PROT|nr:Mth938-like domain-containing protein [Magnetospirillum moscoviense]MBF0323804.1 Mth938-like domain-containing protein [Alphaproteobacteria bacterium]OAN50601.1 hypothetical protein A6A05_12015 [Magnetospirillum moscoviense]
MDITPVVGKEFQLINGYGDGGFTIAGTRHEGSVLILATQTLAWSPRSLGEVTPESLAELFQASPRPTVLLLGCGKGMRPVPKPLRDACRPLGIVVEPMDTGAACRTFNVLLTEGRDVAAALIAV